MPTLLMNVRNVEVWTAERAQTDEKNVLKVQVPWKAKLEPGMNGPARTQVLKDQAPRNLVRDAIELAPQMVQVAIDRLISLQAWPQMVGQRAFADPQRDVLCTHTANCLFKYFNMPANLLQLPESDPNWGYVDKLITLYEKIQTGLSEQYKICIYEKKDGIQGYVEAHTPSMNVALRSYFATDPDPTGHVPWMPVANKDIHLNLEWLKRQLSADSKYHVARTIVHEASHKWAHTLDRCYKHNTKNKVLGKKLAISAGNAGEIPTIQRANRPDKPLLAMTYNDKTTGRFTMQDWLLNADSYGYSAYRMWKHATNKGVTAYDVD